MTTLEHELLAKLEDLRPGTTICPGRLARAVGSRLAEIRPILLKLAKVGRLVVKQRGAVVDLDGLKGPFRVAKK